MGIDAAEPGTILRGKYRIERVLGQGGMGTVLEATHLDLEKRVAIKVLKADLRNAELVERFLREGRAAAKIDSDHVARVLDVDRQDDGTPFMVMEYLEGSDLSAVRRDRRPLPVREAVEYVIQACAGLAKAHALGIVHRDIKPANLFLTRDGQLPRIKVLDFGISKVEASSEGALTNAGVVMGSAEFMSPEQIISTHHVDSRTDIWALGVVLYELLTATTPFGGESFPHVCALVMSTEPTSVRALRADVPAGLEEIIQRCLKKRREGRYETVGHLADALRSTLMTTAMGLGRPPEPVADAGPSVSVSSSVPIHPAPFAPAIALPAALPNQGGTLPHPSPANGYPAPASGSHLAAQAPLQPSATGPGQTSAISGAWTDAALSRDPVAVPALPKRRGPWLALALVGVALLGAGIFWMLPSSQSRAGARSAGAGSTVVSAPAATLSARDAATAPAARSVALETAPPPSSSEAPPQPSSSAPFTAKRSGPTPRPVVPTAPPPPPTPPVIPVRPPPPTSGMD